MGKSNRDFAWKYAKELEGDKNPYCLYCNQISTGGISRLKHHLAGTHHGIGPCKKVPEDVKKECMAALKKSSDLKAKQNALLQEIGCGSGGDYDAIDEEASLPQPRQKGPMDAFVSSKPKQTTLNSAYKKELRIDVCRKIGRLFFDKVLPFNTVNSPFWLPAIAGVAEFGPGFKPPSMYELRTWILKAEVDDMNLIKAEHKKMWEQYGCSIMSDGWTDGKNRVLVNFLVNSQAGTFFLRSIDASDTIKNGENMFKYLDAVIDEVGEENVIQIITDNAANMKNAGKRIMEKIKRVWWTPCAAHCIDLMLEDIGKMKVFKETLDRAKSAVKFIYGHSIILAMLRDFTGNKEIIRPAVTRFATAFLTLQSLYKQKRPLIEMFTSERYTGTSYSKLIDGIEARNTLVHDPNFWPHVAFCIKAVVPLVCVLREVDSEERPTMGFIYELMDKAKENIKQNFNGVKRKYEPIWNKIDSRWTPQLHQPLHAAGYYLNPQLRFEESFSNCDEVKRGLFECMDRMLSANDRVLADVQLDMFDKQRGDFGSVVARKSRHMRSPAAWWERFGSEVPQLMKFAIRVLNLTCSASGCERNWSTFESIHTKKRNSLEHKRLNALAYVKYNTGLRERTIRRRQKMDPILVDDIDSDDEWIAEKEDPIFSSTWIDDEEDIFNTTAIRNVPVDGDSGVETQVPSQVHSQVSSQRDSQVPSQRDSQVPSQMRSQVPSQPTPTHPLLHYKRKSVQGSGNNRGKGKSQKVVHVVEDEDDDETQDVGAIGAMDSGRFPNIDTIDHFDSDILHDQEFGGASASQPNMDDDYAGVDFDSEDLD